MRNVGFIRFGFQIENTENTLRLLIKLRLHVLCSGMEIALLNMVLCFSNVYARFTEHIARFGTIYTQHAQQQMVGRNKRAPQALSLGLAQLNNFIKIVRIIHAKSISKSVPMTFCQFYRQKYQCAPARMTAGFMA